jgi:hypothetical protein
MDIGVPLFAPQHMGHPCPVQKNIDPMQFPACASHIAPLLAPSTAGV